MTEENDPDTPTVPPAFSLGGEVNAPSDSTEVSIPTSWIAFAKDFLTGFERQQHCDEAELHLQQQLPVSDDIDDREYLLSSQPTIVPEANQQHIPMTRRTQLLDGWYQTLLSTGNLRMDEYCDATNHPPVDISHIRMRLKALLTSQSQHPQKALRLSNDGVQFASAAMGGVHYIHYA